MNIVLMNTEEALRLRGCDKAKNNNNRNNSMFSFGPRLKWTEHNNTAAIWSGRTKWSTEKSEADFLLSSFSYIFLKKTKKKVFWDTGNKWIFLQTEHGVGVAGGFWEEFTASAALSSMKERTSIYFFYFSSGHQQPAGLVVVAAGNLAILQGPCNTFSGMSVASHPGTPSTHAHHRCQQENES